MPQTDDVTLSRFVESYRRKAVFQRIAGILLTTATVFFSLFAALQILFAVFPWTGLPLLLDTAAIGAVLFAAARIISAVARVPSLPAAAREIERRSGVRHPLLSISLELMASSGTRSNPFTAAACKQAVGCLASFPAAPSRPHALARYGTAAPLLAAWCLLNPFLSPRLLDFWDLPLSALSRPAATVTPGTKTVPLNAAVTLRLSPEPGRYPSCRLALSALDGTRQSRLLLRPDAGGRFSFSLDTVRESFAYRFSLAGASINDDTISVLPPPRISRLTVTLKPPAYTRLPRRDLPEGQGDFEAYAGSRARVTIESSALARAWLVRGRDSLVLSITGKSATGELQVTSPCDYTFALADSLGQKNDSLPSFRIGCIPDEPPSVRIVRPGFNKTLAPEQAETLGVEGIDDIGIQALRLKWLISGERKAVAGARELPLQSMAPLADVSFLWRLTELSLYPGDTVFYWAETRDTKPFGPPQIGVSDTFWFRIPSFDEIHRAMAQRETFAEKSLGTVRSRQAELEERLARTAAAARGNRELTWEQKQVIRDVKQSMRSQADSLGKTLQALRENIEAMKKQGTVGEELAQKLDAVRKAVEDLVRQYGDSLLFSMKDIEKPLSAAELRSALEKMQALLPKLGEQLDNALKFFEALKRDRKLAELAMRAENLSKEQAALARSADPGKEAANRERDLLDRIGRLSEDVARRTGGDSASGVRADSFMSKAGLDSLRRAMAAAMGASALPSRQTMNEMSGSLLALSQELMQMMQFNLGLRLDRERRRLLALSRDALTMAEWQEELSRAQNGPDDAASTARGQQALSDALRENAASADSLSLLSPDDLLEIGRGYNQARAASQQVIEALGSGNGQAAMKKTGVQLRALANSLLQALSNMENGAQASCSGGACMMPGLRRLSGRQAAINSLTAGLLQSLLSGRLNGRDQTGPGSGEGIEAARREAQAAQNELAKELRKLADKYGKEAGEGMNAKMGELEEEARKLAAMLERPTADISERQDRFLARMLETTLSMHRQDEGKEQRKSRSAEQIRSAGAPAETESGFSGADAFHRLRQRAFQGNFPPAYRGALMRYFDALGERYLK